MQKGYLGSTQPLSSNTVGKANVAGTRFENISNPYSDMPRTQTSWDRLLNWLGFRSGYDKAQEQYNLAGAEYNAQLEQLASEEKYNSPAEQAERMRQAGLNPDLTGVSGEPASEFDNQQQSPDISVGTDVNPLDVIGSIAQGFMGTISGTIGILSDVNLFNQSRIATDTKDLEYAGKMLDFFKQSFPYMTEDSSDPFTAITRNEFEKNPSLFHSSRMAKKFNRVRNNALNSLFGLTTEYKSYDDFYKSALEFGKTLSHPAFSGFGTLSPQEIAMFLQPLSKAQYDLSMAEIKASNATAYKQFHKDAVEGDAYAKLDNPNSGYADDLASSLQAGARADASLAGIGVAQASENLASTRAENSLNQLTITRNKIYERMIKSIDSIPDRSLGSRLLKFFLTQQLSKGINPLKTAGDVAGIAGTVSNAQLNAAKAAKAAASLVK